MTTSSRCRALDACSGQCSSPRGASEHVFSACEDHGVEGIVLKHRDPAYGRVNVATSGGSSRLVTGSSGTRRTVVGGDDRSSPHREGAGARLRCPAARVLRTLWRRRAVRHVPGRSLSRASRQGAWPSNAKIEHAARRGLGGSLGRLERGDARRAEGHAAGGSAPDCGTRVARVDAAAVTRITRLRFHHVRCSCSWVDDGRCRPAT